MDKSNYYMLNHNVPKSQQLVHILMQCIKRDYCDIKQLQNLAEYYGLESKHIRKMNFVELADYIANHMLRSLIVR